MHHYSYPRPQVTVDTVIFRRSDKTVEILLIQRKKDPFQDYWALPGGFMDMDETLEAAAHRELQEETGLSDIPLEFIGVFDVVDRDPRDRTITSAYRGFATVDAVAVAGDDAKAAQWFSLDALPDLAFDHADIIAAALQSAGL